MYYRKNAGFVSEMKYLGYSFVIKRGPIDYDMVQVIVGLWIPVSEARSLVCTEWNTFTWSF